MAKVASQKQIERAFSASPQVQRGMKAVADELEAQARQLTYGRALETGQLARSWQTVKTGEASYTVFSTDPKALWAEGGTGKPESTPRGRMRIVRPRRGKALAFPAPPTWKSVPTGTMVIRKWVKGWDPQHILRDAGRIVGRMSTLRWRESGNPINRATKTQDY